MSSIGNEAVEDRKPLPFDTMLHGSKGPPCPSRSARPARAFVPEVPPFRHDQPAALRPGRAAPPWDPNPRRAPHGCIKAVPTDFADPRGRGAPAAVSDRRA